MDRHLQEQQLGVSPFSISVRLTQTGAKVTGTWLDTQWMDFGGTVEGTVEGTAFAGTVSINQCKARFKGALEERTGEWTSAGLSEDCVPLYSLPHPVDMRVELRR